MAIDFVMPKLAMAMNEGTINEWLVSDGEHVEKGVPLAVVETEKVTYDIEAPQAGYVHIIQAAGATVAVEEPIAKFADSEAELNALKSPEGIAATSEKVSEVQTSSEQKPQAAVAQTSAPSPNGRIKASPLAKKIAADNQLDLVTIKGTGPEGRIVKRDVLQAIQQGNKQQVSHAKGDENNPMAELARIPIKGTMRETIAKRMVESLHTAAQLSGQWESDVTALTKMRQRLVAKEEQLGTRVSMNALIIKAIASAVKQVPVANSSLINGDVVVYKNVNIGLAIALPGKTAWESQLVVPVIHNVQAMGVAEIDIAMKRLIDRAREGALTAQDLSHCTITLSTTAGLAPPGTKSTPVLNLPNAVLVGPSTPQDKPVVRDGEVVVRTMMPMSVTFDHRVMDGEPVARFMSHLHEYLENPELMLA